MCWTTDNFDKLMIHVGQEITVREIVIREQILMRMSEEMAVWLKE